MAASNTSAPPYFTGDGCSPDDGDSATSVGGEDITTADQTLETKPRFGCSHCELSYTTKKSLQRHFNTPTTKCAKRRTGQVETSTTQPKASISRWECSRCRKDCSTFQSVERHIENTCWRVCDECAAEGVVRCDSVSKVGPCRTCEENQRLCTKHTSTVANVVPLPCTGPAVHPQNLPPSDGQAAALTQQIQRKRKDLNSPKVDPGLEHKVKRQAPLYQSVDSYGMDRTIDPLGGQTLVPPTEKRRGVSDWLSEQSMNQPHSAAAGQPQMRNGTSLPPQATSMQMRPGSHQYQSARNPATDLPTYTNALQFQQYPAMMLPQQLQDPNGASVLPTSQSIGLPPAGLPSPLDMQYLPCLGAMPQSASGGPVQTIHRNPQIHNTRPQTGTVPSRYGMAMHIGSNNGLSIPPPLIQPSSLDVSSRPHMFQPQSLCNASLAPTLVSLNQSYDPSMLSIRINSNVYDTRGQPIFSVLRIRRDQIFGPRLEAYCTQRGKRYGVNWMFVWRYPDPAPQDPKQFMQITLTWDMTPDDVKDQVIPSISMQSFDSIYVMQAKSTEGGAVQSPGPQVHRETVDIINGETPIYQSTILNHFWSKAVEQDSRRLRTSLIAAQQEIQEKNILLAQHKKSIDDLVYYSQQLGDRTELALPNQHLQPAHFPVQSALQLGSNAPVYDFDDDEDEETDEEE